MPKYMVLMVLVMLFACLAQAQDYPDTSLAQERAKAARAARMDAMRQLAEAIQGVKIDASTTVKDFITEKDEINTDLQAFLQGVQQIGNPIHKEDGTCEVTLQVNLGDVVRWLKSEWSKHGSQEIEEPEQFDQIYDYNNQSVFTATGSGAMGKNPPPQPPMGNFWARVTPQGKLMAQRAAQVDAYRNLAESVQGVRIDARTKVENFVAVSDEIRSSFQGVIRGAQVVGRPNFHPDGYVEVTVQIDMRQVMNQLRGICQKKYQGNQFNPNSFNQMQQYNPGTQVIKAVGTGVPPARFIQAPSYDTRPYPDQKPVYDDPDDTLPTPMPTPVRPYVPEWADRTVKVTGNGSPNPDFGPGQAKVSAKRAAELDAYRLLAEQVMGLELQSETRVKDFLAEHDEIKTQVHTFLRGMKTTAVRYNEDGNAEVDMELYLGHIWKMIEASYRRQQ